jgi:hypothetical protein
MAGVTIQSCVCITLKLGLFERAEICFHKLELLKKYTVTLGFWDHQMFFWLAFAAMCIEAGSVFV